MPLLHTLCRLRFASMHRRPPQAALSSPQTLVPSSVVPHTHTDTQTHNQIYTFVPFGFSRPSQPFILLTACTCSMKVWENISKNPSSVSRPLAVFYYRFLLYCSPLSLGSPLLLSSVRPLSASGPQARNMIPVLIDPLLLLIRSSLQQGRERSSSRFGFLPSGPPAPSFHKS